MLPYLEKPLELRRSARMKVEIAAKYVSDSLVVEGVVTDVSADGLFFCSDYLDGTGETVRVWLDIPWRSHPLELRGEVRWVNDTPNIGGMGIRFIDVSLEDRMVLSSLGLSALARADSPSDDNTMRSSRLTSMNRMPMPPMFGVSLTQRTSPRNSSGQLRQGMSSQTRTASPVPSR